MWRKEPVVVVAVLPKDIFVPFPYLCPHVIFYLKQTIIFSTVALFFVTVFGLSLLQYSPIILIIGFYKDGRVNTDTFTELHAFHF